MLGATWVASRGEPELARAALNLIAKIVAIVPERLRPHILEPATSIAPVAQPTVELVSSSLLRSAIRSRHKLAISYRDNAGEVTERVVWPVLLGYRDAGRILAAWCELRTGFRYFRTDRMASARVLPDRVPEHSGSLRARWRNTMDQERARYVSREPGVDALDALGPTVNGQLP